MIAGDFIKTTKGENLTHENLQSLLTACYRLAMSAESNVDMTTPEFLNGVKVCMNSENKATKSKALKLVHPISAQKEDRKRVI